MLMTSETEPARAAHPAVRLWLAAMALLLLTMVIVGGATRLTDSGLSITEWQPILGAIPPLSDADWQGAFEKYKQIPEYKLVNKGMSLAAFKVIFWWEWAHRFLGRLIGLAFALPLAVFAWRGMLPAGRGGRLVAILALGGLQGAVGWYMVRSGLVDRVDVSQYRLALHLSIALVILALLVWELLEASAPPVPTGNDRPLAPQDRAALRVLLALIALQIVAGAFVAGLRAGVVYNTWPLMDGRFIPEGLGTLVPWYRNLFESTLTVQFIHRMLAYAVLATALWHAGRLMSRPETGWAAVTALGLLVALLAQAAIGIWTLLEGVPLSLGLLHQGGAAVIVALAVWHAHRVGRHRR